MRVVLGKHLMGLLVAVLCAAAGCSSSKQITSVEGPLTPYSPSAVQASNAALQPEVAGAPRAAAPQVNATPTSTAGTGGPINFSPGMVDPDLLDPEEKKPTTFERVQDYMSPKRISERWRKLVGREPDEDFARHNYNLADLAFREGDFEEAAEHFKVAADRWPDSNLQEDALFMLGESYFQMNYYPKASNSWRKLVKKYENSRHLDLVIKRRFAIGRYWEQRSKDDPVHGLNFKDKSMPVWDTISNTVAIYESIRMDDPTGPLADDATMATANTLFINGRWEDAAYHYDLMRTEFPQSEFQAQAHLLGMQAKLRSYQGPHYDPRPLLEAKKLGQTLQTQFAAQLPGERENIAQALKTIEAQLAERDYSLGQFYQNSRHYYAARYYYTEVVKQYPQSRFADLAKAEMDKIKDKPPDSKNEIEWLASKFKRAPQLPAAAQPPGNQAPGGAPGVPGQPQDQPFLAGPGQPAPGAVPQMPPTVARQPGDQR